MQAHPHMVQGHEEIQSRLLHWSLIAPLQQTASCKDYTQLLQCPGQRNLLPSVEW